MKRKKRRRKKKKGTFVLVEVDRERKKSSDRLDSARKRNPVRDAFRTTWELGRCPFPPPSTRGNRISVSRAIGARVSARKATFIRHSSEKPRVVVVGRLLFCLVVALRRFGEERGRGGYSSPLLGANRILSRATRLVRSTPPRIQCDRWNANKKHRTKVATAPRVDERSEEEHRGVSSLRFARTSFPSSMTVPCANTRRRRRSRIDTPTTFPSRPS